MIADGTPLARARAELNARCNAIEEAYEFMLAYAGQGLASDSGSAKGSQVRDYLSMCDEALEALTRFSAEFAATSTDDAGAPYRDFLAVIDHDARNARAAVRLLLAQPSISSQMVDNLNASTHLRAVLTDLFLVDEVLKTQIKVG
ncbi:MAG: hypothetical protein AB7Q29_14355 [Vicinamibacterales bacterium]